MVNAATRPEYGGTGAASWTRMNGSDLGNPVDTVYPLGDPNRYPAWVTGRLSDHPGLNLTYDREMAALAATPVAVGDLATLPAQGSDLSMGGDDGACGS